MACDVDQRRYNLCNHPDTVSSVPVDGVTNRF